MEQAAFLRSKNFSELFFKIDYANALSQCIQVKVLILHLGENHFTVP
jgi:hypothetical protein